MKNKKLIICLIIILSIIVIGLSSFMISIIKGNIKLPYFKFNSTVSDNLVIDEEYDNEFDKIEINTNASDIVIKKSTDNNVNVKIYGDKDKSSVNVNNNELVVESKTKACQFICINQKISKIELYIPEDYSKLIYIKNNYGDINIDEFLNANIEIFEDYGDVSILGVDTLTVDNKYGDLNLEKVKKASIDQSAGDIKIDTVDNVEIKSNYGDVKIRYINNYFSIDSDCGDVKIDNINIKENSSITNDLGDIEIGNTNEIYIKAHTSLGDVEINNNYPKDNTSLELENNCGDIIVKN